MRYEVTGRYPSTGILIFNTDLFTDKYTYTISVSYLNWLPFFIYYYWFIGFIPSFPIGPNVVHIVYQPYLFTLVSQASSKHYGEFFVASQSNQCSPQWVNKIFTQKDEVPGSPKSTIAEAEQ